MKCGDLIKIRLGSANPNDLKGSKIFETYRKELNNWYSDSRLILRNPNGPNPQFVVCMFLERCSKRLYRVFFDCRTVRVIRIFSINETLIND